MTSRTGFILALILCAAAFLYSIGSRLTDQAVNMIVGVLCGIAASIPVSVGLLVALTRRRAADEEDQEVIETYPAHYPNVSPRPAQPAYPPVIVVAPPQSPFPNSYSPMLPPGYNMNEPPISRDFRIIGEDDELGE